VRRKSGGDRILVQVGPETVDLLRDTRWGKVDKLLQSEAPAGLVSPGRGCWKCLLFENSIVCQVC
jgi:hypothetical protein